MRAPPHNDAGYFSYVPQLPGVAASYTKPRMEFPGHGAATGGRRRVRHAVPAAPARVGPDDRPGPGLGSPSGSLAYLGSSLTLVLAGTVADGAALLWPVAVTGAAIQ